MPECKSHRDVDESIGPDDHYDTMASDVAFLCIVVVHICASHKSREWLGDNGIIQNYISRVVDASDEKDDVNGYLLV